MREFTAICIIVGFFYFFPHRMAPRNVVEEPMPTPSHADTAEIVDDPTPRSKRATQKVVWRNVLLMSALHLASLYALFLIPKSHPPTWLWGKAIKLLFVTRQSVRL